MAAVVAVVRVPILVRAYTLVVVVGGGVALVVAVVAAAEQPVIV